MSGLLCFLVQSFLTPFLNRRLISMQVAQNEFYVSAQLLQFFMQLGTRKHTYERKKVFSKSRKIMRQIRKIMCIVPTFIYCTQESFFMNQSSAQRSYIAFVAYKITTSNCRLSTAPLQTKKQSIFHCFTVQFDSLSFIYTNSCTFSYNHVSVF